MAMIRIAVRTIVLSAELAKAATRRRLGGGPCVAPVIGGCYCCWSNGSSRARLWRDGGVVASAAQPKLCPGFLCFARYLTADTQWRDLAWEDKEWRHLGVLLVKDIGSPEVRIHFFCPLRFPLAPNFLFAFAAADGLDLPL
jgi:hypothetical protein